MSAHVVNSSSTQSLVEEWKAVPAFQGYRVSNFGRVQTCRSPGNGNRLTENWRDMKTGRLKHGHRYARFSKNSKMTRIYVHRLVLELFVGPCPEGMECCHNDGNPENNHVSNLRWSTHRDNLNDRRIHGTMNWGERCGTSKLNRDQVREIRKLKAEGAHSKELAKRFGVCYQHIDHIIRGRNWSFLDAS